MWRAGMSAKGRTGRQPRRASLAPRNLLQGCYRPVPHPGPRSRPRGAQGARPHLHRPGEEDARVRRQLLHVEVHGAPHGRPRPAPAKPGAPRPPPSARTPPTCCRCARPQCALPPATATAATTAATAELARARRAGRRVRREEPRSEVGRGGVAELDAARCRPLRPPPAAWPVCLAASSSSPSPICASSAPFVHSHTPRLLGPLAPYFSASFALGLFAPPTTTTLTSPAPLFFCP